MSLETVLEDEVKKFDDVATQRLDVINRYRFLSPAIFVQQSLNNVAGTGADRYADYESQVTAFHKTFRAYFAPLVYCQEKFTPAQLDAVPIYGYQTPSYSNFSGNNIANWGFLVISALLFSSFAGMRVRRVDLAFG
jgi:ABC-2 type transport system permease protein